MVIKDFFWLNDEKYAERIKGYTTPRLKKQEKVKGQQKVSALLATGSGIGLAWVTFGCTLGVSAYGVRRHNVARRKHSLIRNEISSRKIELHEPTKRDFCIPISVFTCGVCFGAGVGHGLPSGASAVGMMAVDPSGAAAGVTAGAVEGLKAVVDASSPQVSHSLVSEGVCLPSVNVVDSFDVGYTYGMLGVNILGITVEKSVANIAASATADKVLNTMLDPKKEKDDLSLDK